MYACVCVHVNGFAKTLNNPARTEIQIMAWHESHTLALSRHINDRARSAFTGIISVTL